jgi:hypothetical protein
MTDAELRQLYEEMLARRVPEARAHCVAPELLRAIVEGRAPAPDRIGALRHVSACPACRADLDLLRAVAAAARGLRRRFGPAVAVAASLAVLTGAAAWWRAGLGSRTSQSEPPGVGAGGVTLIGPIGTVAGVGPVVLSWHALPRAVRYHVQVLDVGGRIVFAASTSDTTAALSGRAPLIPDADYRWSVRALRLDGSGPPSSSQRFRVRPR